jgi:hypothetical protein
MNKNSLKKYSKVPDSSYMIMDTIIISCGHLKEVHYYLAFRRNYLSVLHFDALEANHLLIALPSNQTYYIYYKNLYFCFFSSSLNSFMALLQFNFNLLNYSKMFKETSYS